LGLIRTQRCFVFFAQGPMLLPPCRPKGQFMRIPSLLVMLCLAAPALACGPDSDCMVGDRSYRLYLPPSAQTGPVGALVFAHGYKGKAAQAMDNTGLRQVADDLGLALIALQSGGDDWAVAHVPQAPDRTETLEYGYVDAVLADAATRATIDPARRVAAGFSAGGMMIWTLACGASDRFRGFVAVSGTFWAPMPDTCPTPAANLVQIHGTADTMVPLEGRVIGDARQGDVAEALAMYAAHGGFRPEGTIPAPGDMTCQTARNPAGKLLAFCTFDGGHDFSTVRLRYALDQIFAAP
jgi:polyhydroxybutyrate depolymerase